MPENMGKHKNKSPLFEQKGGSASFSYLLDADDARIVSRNTLEMTVQHVN